MTGWDQLGHYFGDGCTTGAEEENALAEEIRDANGGGYVPLSIRYPHAFAPRAEA